MASRKGIFLIVLFLLFLCTDLAYGAHILEPLGTETAATPPRGRMFGQLTYAVTEPNDQASHNISAFSIEFEAGIGEKTQLNLEAETLLNNESGDNQEKGVEEISFGLKQRFLDETEMAPDSAIEVEFVPSSGFDIDERSILATIILSKNITPEILVHLNLGYRLKTGIKTAGPETIIDRDGIGIINVTPIFKAIPDKLMLMTEFNAKIDPAEDTLEIVFSPEVIFVVQTATFFNMQNMAFKFAFPIGLTNDSPDIGVQFGVSKLF